MVNQTERPKATPFKVFVAISCGLLPYVGGLLVTLTRRIVWLALAGVAISVISTSAAYALRKSTDPVRAKKRLKVDPLLYGFEFAFTAVVIYRGLKRTTTTPIILCVLGAISWFGMSLWLRSYKVRSKPPASRAHLSLEERQQRIRIGSWIAFGTACVLAIGAILIACLQHTAGRRRNIAIARFDLNKGEQTGGVFATVGLNPALEWQLIAAGKLVGPRHS